MSKQQLIKQSLKLISDNPSHTFFAVTVRPYEAFIKSFAWHERVTVTEKLLETIINHYDSHLIKYPNKPKNQHLKIISHNAIETKTKSGAPDIPHSHGIWGIHDSLLEKWNADDLDYKIWSNATFEYENNTYPLSKAIHSIEKSLFRSSLIAKTYPEGWLNYAYKWALDTAQSSEWSDVNTPKIKTKREKINDPDTSIYLPRNKVREPISQFPNLV
jgi:hypothetical protein